MVEFSEVVLSRLVTHKVGNKSQNQPLLLSKEGHGLEDELLRGLLLDYFLKPFKSDEYYKFTHHSDLAMNEMFVYCSRIFENKMSFYEQSTHIANFLYDCSVHPKIKSGELYVAYLQDCVVEGEITDAIGLFKSENKELYLKTREQGEEKVVIEYEQGVNVRKLDKGCLIFNTFKNEGFRLLIVDKSNRGANPVRYWEDDFLHVIRAHDDAFSTQAHLHMCRDFCLDVYVPEHDADKRQQVQFLNKSLDYFAQNDRFEFEAFTEGVLNDKPDLAKKFTDYSRQYAQENGFNQPQEFAISKPAFRSVKRQFKSIIQLDTLIEIKLYPDRSEEESNEQYIERGFDKSRNMSYYKLYFNEEF